MALTLTLEQQRLMLLESYGFGTIREKKIIQIWLLLLEFMVFVAR